MASGSTTLSKAVRSNSSFWSWKMRQHYRRRDGHPRGHNAAIFWA